MRIHRRSTSSRRGRSRIAPIGVSLVSGLALIGGFTISTAVGAAPAGASGPSFTPTAAKPTLEPAQPLSNGKNSHAGQVAPTVSSTPHVIAHSAVNQTFTVNTNNDTDLATSGSTTCIDSDGNCSLRAAVEAADNDYPNVDQINVPDGSDIQLTQASALDVTNSMFISGVGSGAAPIVDGLGGTVDFSIDGSGGFVPAVEMSNLTIQGGSGSDGGNIALGDGSDAGDLTLSASSVTGGAAEEGGGIYVNAYSALWTDPGTSITNNTAYECGGGIANESSNTGSGGQIDISGSTISGNSADCGGGIYNEGAAVLDAAQINNNSAESGGAVLNDWSLTDTGSSYNGNNVGTSTNPVDGPEGGVLWNDDTANLTDVTVSNTQSYAINDGVEGGVFFNSWQMSLTNVTVNNTTNRADGLSIEGGVIANEAYNCCPSDGTLTVNGLNVSGTSNGTSDVETEVDGGVLFNDFHASLNGFTVSSTTNNVGDDYLYGGVGDVEYTTGCCPSDYDGQTSYQDINVSGTTNVQTGSGYMSGGVFAVDYDEQDAAPLSGDISGGTITGTTDNIGDGELDGGVIGTFSDISLDNVSIGSTTVNAAGASVYGGAVSAINYEIDPSFYTDPSTSANDVSVTNTNITNVGGGDGYVEGGAWFASADLTANGVQTLGTTVNSDEVAFGGALSVDDYDMNDAYIVATVTNSTFASTNTTVQSGGGPAVALFMIGETSLTNVTADDNTSSSPSNGGYTLVGLDGTLSFTNDTVANDTVSGSDSDGIYSETAMHMKNTIVGTVGAPNCAGTGFTSNGGNLEAGGNTCNFNLPSDQTNVGNAMVSSVGDNSGPVQTAALQPGSPAIGKGVSAGCPTTDARGVARPSGNCDVGAFQLSTQGYWMVASDGGIFNFANAGFYGSMGSTPLNAPIVGMAVTPDGKGYWEVASDGGIFNFGDAQYYGSMGGKKLNDPVVGMAAAPGGNGYWLVASDGGIFSFGPGAKFFGSTGSLKLNKPVVGMAAAPGGNGYWFVAADGGIFNYGPGAGFFGSAGSLHLNKPVVGMAPAPNGTGYWLVASDGGIFTYGTDVNFFGSTGSIHLNKPVVGMAATPSGDGYWLFASDGGVFNYGDATFQGSMGGTPLNKPVVGGAANSID